MDGEDQYHLKWNDYHSSLTACFRDLRDNEEMLDVTICSDGKTFKAHKLVLSACSPVFKEMLQNSKPLLQPFVYLHGVRHEDVEAILDFMYKGEVSVSQLDLRNFLAVAEDLRVRGLTQSRSGASKTDDENEEEQVSRIQKRKRRRSGSGNEHSSPVRKNVRSPPYQQDFSSAASRRSSSSMEPVNASGNLSYHYLGGRDHGDPLTNMLVTHSDRGWHCPDCIHIATTKGNLKSHILSGRHKLTEKSFKCRFCERSYSTRQSMQVHISTNHRHERNAAKMEGEDLSAGAAASGTEDQEIEYENDDEISYQESANNQEVIQDHEGNYDE